MSSDTPQIVEIVSSVLYHCLRDPLNLRLEIKQLPQRSRRTLRLAILGYLHITIRYQQIADGFSYDFSKISALD